jgi:hypothetical protein
MEFTDLKIIGVGREAIEKENSFEQAYKYPYVLSGKPDDLWIKFFHSIYRMHSYDKKRQYTIIDKHIVVIISAEDKRQQFLDFLKDVVNSTNQKYRELLLSKEEERHKEEARKKKEREKIQELRGEVDHLNFS